MYLVQTKTVLGENELSMAIKKTIGIDIGLDAKQLVIKFV